MSFTCRRGHYSLSDDYCDVCGARNWSARSPAAQPAVGQGPAQPLPAAPAPLPPAPAPPPTIVPAPPPEVPVATAAAAIARMEQPCPVCSTLREGSDRYCPNCAYDFETGEAWDAGAEEQPPDEAFRPASGLVVVVGVDGSRSSERVEGPSMVIGRDEGPGIHVPIPADPYVSRRHAELIDLGGQWALRDLGSTNGTRLNGAPLAGSEVRLVGPNDVVEVGCFSRLTIRERSAQGTGP